MNSTGYTRIKPIAQWFNGGTQVPQQNLLALLSKLGIRSAQSDGTGGWVRWRPVLPSDRLRYTPYDPK